MPVEVEFIANTAKLLRGTKDIEGALDEVSSSLDDVARDGKTAGNKLGDGITDGTKEAETGADRLERSFRDLARTSKTVGSDSGKGISTGVKRGTDDAGEALGEFRRESASTATESAASFDGSAESIIQSFQEVAANAFQGFGPAGMLAGLAAAAGIGLAVAAMDQAGANTEELQAKTQELAQEYINTGGIGEEAITGIVDRLKDLATEQDTAKVSLSKLETIAKNSGSSYEDLAQAYAGNVDGLKQLWREGDRYRKQLEDEAGAASTATDAGKSAYGVKVKQAVAQREYMDYLGQTLGVAKAAAEADRLYAAAGGPELAAKAALIATIDSAYDDAAGAASDYINAESGLLDTGAYIAAMLAKEQAIRDYQETLATSPLTDAAKAFLDSQGVEAAAQFLAGYKTATPEQQAELNRIWTEAGSTSSGAFTDALTKGIPASVPGPAIEVLAPDIANLVDSMNYRARNFVVQIPSILVDRNGSPLT